VPEANVRDRERRHVQITSDRDWSFGSVAGVAFFFCERGYLLRVQARVLCGSELRYNPLRFGCLRAAFAHPPDRSVALGEETMEELQVILLSSWGVVTAVLIILVIYRATLSSRIQTPALVSSSAAEVTASARMGFVMREILVMIARCSWKWCCSAASMKI
jgi:hypothetical protein